MKFNNKGLNFREIERNKSGMSSQEYISKDKQELPGASFVDDAQDFSWILSDLISWFCPDCEVKSWTRESDFGTPEVEAEDESILKASDKQSLATSRLSASLAEPGSTAKQVMVELSVYKDLCIKTAGNIQVFGSTLLHVYVKI